MHACRCSTFIFTRDNNTQGHPYLSAVVGKDQQVIWPNFVI